VAQIYQGEQFYENGDYKEAQIIFDKILIQLDNKSDKYCFTLTKLGRCLYRQNKLEEAQLCYQQGLKIAAKQLNKSQLIERQIGLLHTDLADTLVVMGDYNEARKSYKIGLQITEQQKDPRQLAIIKGQIGILDLIQKDLEPAEKYLLETISIFHQINEPKHEAIYLNELAFLYKDNLELDKAEENYRKAVKIQEQQDLVESARIYNNLGNLNCSMGKHNEAE